MEDWVKVYEEIINELPEKIEDLDFWANEILKDNAIPFKNRIDMRNESGNVLQLNGYANYIEVYVSKENENIAIELLKFQEDTAVNTGIEFYLKQNEIKDLDNFENEKEYILDLSSDVVSSEEYVKQMKKIEKIENKKFWIFFVIMLFIIISSGLLICFTKVENELIGIFNEINSLLIIMLCFISILAVLIDKCLVEYIKYKKEKIKSKNAVSTIKRVIYPNQYSKFGITEDFFKNTLIYEAFEHYNSYKSCDKITGKYKENEFLLSELCLRYIESYYSGVRPRLKYDIETIFDGIFIKTRIFNTINSRVYIEPKNYWDTSKNNEEYSEIAFDELNKNKFYFNSANIKAEFENNFKVYEMREENGAEILNESFIEEILKLKEKYNKDIFICISDNIANIMINNMKVFDEKIFVEEGLNTENILKSVNIVEEIIDIVKNFDIIEKQ